MKAFWAFLVLSQITRSPLIALVMVVVGGWVLDRFTFGFLPNPWRWLQSWQRAGRLERTLAVNPHDRRTRLELADLLNGWGRHARALEAIKPNLSAGDHDVTTLFVAGVAAYNSGHAKEAEILLDEALDEDPSYRMGEIHLELARGRIRQQDWPAARGALEQFLAQRRSTVEGRVLLARVLDRLGEPRRAAALREEAWIEYARSPGYLKRRERRFAWSVKPLRAVLVVGSVGFAISLVMAALLLCLSLEDLASRAAVQARTQRDAGRRAGPSASASAGATPEEPVLSPDDDE